MRTHFAESTETRPSFGPSFSRTTEWGHLYRIEIEDDGTDKKDLTYFHVSIKPGSYTAPQLKYLTPSTSGVFWLNSFMLVTVRHSNALPSPPPLGKRSRRDRTEDRRSRPTVSRKWSAKEEPRCGVAIVVMLRMLNLRWVRWVVRYRQSRPP